MSFFKETTAACLKEAGWLEHLQPFLGSSHSGNLREFLAERMSQSEVYPKTDDWFAALKLTPFDDVKVVIIGQDPYHGPKQANGLAFGVNAGRPQTPSLRNIMKEVGNDLNCETPRGRTLVGWAKQGVLLINTVLTVERGRANSHANHGWEVFTDCIIQALLQKKSNIVFMLWGNHAQKKAGNVSYKHLKLEAGHPSPLNVRLFSGCKHFTKANEWLVGHDQNPIDWQCVDKIKKKSLLDVVSNDDDIKTRYRIKEVSYVNQD